MTEQVIHFQELASKYQGELRNAKSELASLRSELDLSKKHNLYLTKTIESQSQQIAGYGNEVLRLREELALKENKIESLKEDINDLNLRLSKDDDLRKTEEKIIIQDFTKKFKEGIQDMPPHIAAIVNKHFFELL